MKPTRSDKHFGPGDHLKLSKLEPTPEKNYLSRRKLIKKTLYGGVIGSAAALWTYRGWSQVDQRSQILQPGVQRDDILKRFPFPPNEKFNPNKKTWTDPVEAGAFNNFYEFLPGRAGPIWKYAQQFEVDPWRVEIDGECRKPQTLDLDDLFDKFGHEQRVYRHRCVEAWAMVVPWSGFPLSKLLERVEPTDHAKFVRFVTADRPEQMPGMKQSIADGSGYPWPYYEAIRMDEAMHELAFMVMGIYGKPLSRQHGAPIRLATPWKYGYKSIKSIVKIELLREQPGTFWAQTSNGAYKHEYGFLSNVNPNTPHPRWPQTTEQMLGDGAKRVPTTIYNGYGEYVAKLYPDEPTQAQLPLRRGETAR